jgi:hypothetical protein
MFMTLNNLSQVWAIGLIFTLFLSACSAIENVQLEQENAEVSTTARTDTPNEVKVTSEEIDQKGLYQKIQQLAAESRQCESDNDCALLGLGARPCGGPDEYLVYSKSSANQSKLLDLARNYNLVAKSRNEKEGRMGICVVATRPKFYCTQNQCASQLNANHY